MSGDRKDILAALEEAARPLAAEHGGDGSEPRLDLACPLARAQLREAFAETPGILEALGLGG